MGMINSTFIMFCLFVPFFLLLNPRPFRDHYGHPRPVSVRLLSFRLLARHRMPVYVVHYARCHLAFDRSPSRSLVRTLPPSIGGLTVLNEQGPRQKCVLGA